MSDPAMTAKLQHLVDQAASFDVFAAPDPARYRVLRDEGSGGDPASGTSVGFQLYLDLHRFSIRLAPTDNSGTIRASNTVAESCGHFESQWMMIPRSFIAHPDRPPETISFDPGASQRFVMQRGELHLGNGKDGFQCFGAGRTFPSTLGGRPHLIAAAVGNFTEGFGKLRGYHGNFTLCGELTREEGFRGHMMVRIVDPAGQLLSDQTLPVPGTGPASDSGITYITWVAQKEDDPELENTWSYTPDGEMRGINIPVRSKRVETDFSAAPDFKVQRLAPGPAVGLEIGFGRETQARRPDSGTELTPFQFEGVSEYFFYGADGSTVGSLTANFLEGRSIQMQLPGAESAPALRFGYFGAIVGGKGCFEGVEGMIYGTAGSVFAPPPFEHVITNLYVARLHDPDGKFRYQGAAS